MDKVHVIFTEYPGYGWSFDSPQLPGLSNMASTLEEARVALDDALDTMKVPGGQHIFVLHEQKFLTDEDGNEYLVRFGVDEASFDAAVRIIGSILEGDVEPDKMPMNRAEDRLVIGVDASNETLRGVNEQLRPDEAALLVHHAGDDVVYHLPYGNSSHLLYGWDIDDLGLTLDSTVQEALDAVLTREAGELQPHHASPSDQVHRTLQAA